MVFYSSDEKAAKELLSNPLERKYSVLETKFYFICLDLSLVIT